VAYIPHYSKLDASLTLLSEGYPFFLNRCRELGTNAFRTRLMLKPVTCVMGEEAAHMFYQPDRFIRKRAMPPTTLMLLQDLGSVQMKSGEAHRQRKQLFMSLLSSENVQQVVEEAERQWDALVPRWESSSRAVLHDQIRETFCRASCHWAGIPLPEEQVAQRTHEFGAMIDGAGAVGPRNWKGLALRHRTERWVTELVQQVRDGTLEVPEQSPLAVVAAHRESDGRRLAAKVAAVELVNLVRPTIAVARFATFAALALHQYPHCREKIAQGDAEYLEWFAQEVRRFYPFFPSIGGRVNQEFSWKGTRFNKGDWVLLDIYGTNHDPRIWQEPDAFNPERFRNWNGSPFNFIPQGGGSYHDGHRCPGEKLAIELTKAITRRLVSDITYDVPEQDLTLDVRKMPALPASGFVITNVRKLK
jgi:fatty-acid peroxygenase